MPSNTLVCFTCRETKSRIRIACSGDTHREPSSTCPKCNGEMHEVYNIATPKKSDHKAWKAWQKITQVRIQQRHQKAYVNECARNMLVSRHVK